MAMRIQSNLELTGVVPRQAAARVGNDGNAAGPGIKSGSVVPPSDTAKLSPAARSALAASANDEVRAEKVTAIQQAIASGSYAVSPSDVAGKLIDHLLGG